MAQSSPSLTSVKGRVIFINIRNVYATTNKEIRLALVDSTGARRDYEFTASFGETFIDIRREDDIGIVWTDEASRSLHSIRNLRSGTDYIVPVLTGCGSSVLIAVCLLGVLAFALRISVPR